MILPILQLFYKLTIKGKRYIKQLHGQVETPTINTLQEGENLSGQ